MKSLKVWSAAAAAGAAIAAAILVGNATNASAVLPIFTATPHSNTALGMETVAAVDKCVAPVGAGDWVAIVNVAQGANPQVSYKNFLIAGDGSWGGTLTLPAGLSPGPATLTAACFDAQHHVADEVNYASIALTITTPPSSSAATTPATSSASTGITSSQATPSSTGGGGLANTGFRYTVPLTVLALGAVFAGIALLVGTRRRAH